MLYENGIKNIAEIYWRTREIFAERGRRSSNGGFDAAQVSAIYNDWMTSIHSINQDIKSGHNKIVARARESALNDGYAKKFLNTVNQNMIGPGGFVLRNKAFDWGKDEKTKKSKKIFDTVANTKIEEAHYEWGKPKYYTITGQGSAREVDGLIVKTVARDGEIFIRKVNVDKYKNPFGFSVQLIETEYCDVNYNKLLPNGNYIYMGIEFDQKRIPVRYYFRKSKPQDESRYVLSNDYISFPAEEIIHLYIRESTYQVRGISWLVPMLIRLHMLKEYENAMLVKVRLAANSGIILEKKEDTAPNPFAGINGAKKDTDGNYTKNWRPGEAFIADGYKVSTIDLNAPNGQEISFIQSVLLGAAAGGNVAYTTFSGDWKNFNYSASRMELGQEQEGWKGLQSWYIEHFKEPLMESWLEVALTTKAVDLSIDKFDKFFKPWFYGRRWPYYKPSEEISADIDALDAKIMTLEEVLSKRGVDLMDHIEQLKYEKQLFEDFEITKTEPKPNSFEIVKKNGKANKEEIENAKAN